MTPERKVELHKMASKAAAKFADLLMDRDLDQDALDSVGWMKLNEKEQELVYDMYKERIKEDI